MRSLALALLLTTAAVAPAAAQERDERVAEESEPERPRAERRQQREERSEARSERRERIEIRRGPGEAGAEERSLVSPRAVREASTDAAEAPGRRPVMERLREAGSRPERREVARRRPVVAAEDGPADEPEVRLTGDSVRDWRPRERRREETAPTIEEVNVRLAPPIAEGGREELAESSGPATVTTDGGLVQPTRPLPRVLDPDRPRRRVSRTPLPGTEPPPPATASASVAEPQHRWRRDWRHDRRFDWRDHRRRHRSLFHLGFYFDPFGWRYYRYGVGWRLWPSYYSSRFWLHDPWHWRLPPAYGPYRWIRYYDDALLVNVYTGHVVDVIHDFFW